MVVNMTPIARSKMIDLLRSQRMTSIIFSVKGGGCNGFNYDFKPTSEEKGHNRTSEEKWHNNNDNNKFDEIVPIDSEHSLIVCGHSLFHLLGVTIDYKETVMGSGFDFKNPNASGSCGCGKSFN